MKKLLVILLSSVLVLALAACGGGNDSPTPSDSGGSSNAKVEPDVEPSNAADDADDATDAAIAAYEASMSEFITNFETLSVRIGELMAGYDGSQEWYATFATVYQALVDSTDILANSAAQAPEEYQESHVKITVAVAAYGDMMDAFGTAVDAYQAGDTATGDEQMATVQGLYEAAVQLWSESVESAE